MDSRIRVYSKTNGGLSDTRNCGIQASTGDYITFIDSDDYVSKNYLSYLLKLFSYSDKCSITTCNRQMVKEGKLGHKFNYNDKNGVMIQMCIRDSTNMCRLWRQARTSPSRTM